MFGGTKEEFVESCAFAKVVSTPNGDALLIAGTVIELRYNTSLAHLDVAASLATAMRKAARYELRTGAQMTVPLDAPTEAA